MKRLDIIWDDVYNESAIKCERRKMSTIVELMLAIREGYTIFIIRIQINLITILFRNLRNREYLLVS